MNKTNDILEKLKAAEQPIIDNPDELTDLIMSILPEQDAPQKEQPQKPQAILIALRIITSMAALWMIGLFLYTSYTEPSLKAQQGLYGQTIDLTPSSTLKDVYTSRLRASQQKSISYTQLKTMHYEKE